MPAAVRGGSQTKAKPRAKAPLKPAQRPRSKPSGAAAPARGRPTPGHGPSPKLILGAAAALLVLAGVAVLATGHRAQRIATAVQTGVDGKFGQAGFRLRKVRVEGASPMAMADIVRAAGVFKDQPLLGLDLPALRQHVEAVGWVKEARIERLLPDTLVISVIERRQLAVWQHEGKTSVIDEHGQPIPEADPARFASLPLVVGEGGGEAAPKILPLLAQRPKLMGRMDALVRVDDRRWDLRMQDGSLIQLPAVGEEEALMQLEQLDQRSRILDLGFERIDLRNPDVVAVRPREPLPPGQLPPAGA
ncbi:MAG: FtsQ-type POTRA domain-containing protein [Phenylobacterium sp.]|nr:MAG: FtsQ-type POTRA domain-containing protein [Phenylobacterium sp.]